MTASEERFDGFVREASPGLLRAAWLMVGDWWAAEDLVQAAFEKTWPRWGRLADDGQRLAYLHRVVANAFMRGRRRKWTGEIATSELPQCAAADETDALVLRASVVAAVRGLPPRQRAVIALRVRRPRRGAAMPGGDRPAGHRYTPSSGRQQAGHAGLGGQRGWRR